MFSPDLIDKVAVTVVGTVVPWLLNKCFPTDRDEEETTRHVYNGVDPHRMRELEESIRSKNKEMEDLKTQYIQQVDEAKVRYCEEIEKQQETIHQISQRYEQDLERIEAAKAKEIGAMKEELNRKDVETAKKLSQMQLNELQQRRDTQLQSVKPLGLRYQQLFQDCQRYNKECLKFHQQAEKEMAHLKTRFKYEGEDKNMIRLILYGQSGHGKSTLANRFCKDTSEKGDKGPFATGGDPESVTEEIKKHCREKDSIYKYGLSVTDQPGTYDTQGRDREYANNLVEYLRGIGHINAIGLVKTYQPPRLEGSHQSMMRALEDMLGGSMWKHVVIVLTNTPPKIQDTDAFKDYCQKFRATVRKQLQLDEQSAPLPIIGVDLHNFENCQKQLPRLVNETLASLPKFRCENLKSPLDDLLTEKKHKISEFESKFKELLDMEQFLANLDNKIYQTEQEIAKRDHRYRPMYQKVSRNLSKQIEREWDKKNSRNNNNSDNDYGYNHFNRNAEEKADERNNNDYYYEEYNDNFDPNNMNSAPMEMEGDDLAWSCSSCTYINQSTFKNCEMCEQSRLIG